MGRRIVDWLRSAGRPFFAAAVAVVAGCGGPPPTPESPTFDRVAVSHRSVGIPYHAVVVFQVGDQLSALRVNEAQRWGYTVYFEWRAAPNHATTFAETSRGSGYAQEVGSIGSMDAGPLYMQWSRGSLKNGWLYWPEWEDDISVCSITWPEFEDIDLSDPEIFWYRQEMFE